MTPTPVGCAGTYSPSIRRHRGNMTASAAGEQQLRTGRRAERPSRRVEGHAALVRARRWIRSLGKRGSANPPARWKQPAIPTAWRQCDGRLGLGMLSSDAPRPRKGEVRLSLRALKPSIN